MRALLILYIFTNQLKYDDNHAWRVIPALLFAGLRNADFWRLSGDGRLATEWQSVLAHLMAIGHFSAGRQ